ncbi:Ig-like domain-containing protein [Devosia albogilva]|uniref:Ig-like domain-containing protein n=1 Tax=Devosia albogilva TaxID=429726 RepID=A0ABW5QKF0_9HYPH
MRTDWRFREEELIEQGKVTVKRKLSGRAKTTALVVLVLVLGLVALIAAFWIKSSDQEPPRITAVSPVANAAGVSPGARVQVSFNHAFPTVFDVVSLRLWNAQGDRIIGAFEVHSTETAAMLAPVTELAPGKYRAEARIGDGEAVEWEFTVSEPDPWPESIGPILVISSEAGKFGDYYAEIGRVPGRGVTEVVKPLASAPLRAP